MQMGCVKAEVRLGGQASMLKILIHFFLQLRCADFWSLQGHGGPSTATHRSRAVRNLKVQSSVLTNPPCSKVSAHRNKSWVLKLCVLALHWSFAFQLKLSSEFCFKNQMKFLWLVCSLSFQINKQANTFSSRKHWQVFTQSKHSWDFNH